MSGEKFMALAREQGRLSLDSGGVPVGALLVRGAEILGRGHNQRGHDCAIRDSATRDWRESQLWRQ
jgi:tRNA(Arg) A34 adenosine deaminase TadA